MKDLQEWKEAPLDCILLSLYHLQAFYFNEIKRGFAGLGEYNVVTRYQSLQLDVFSCDYIPTNSPQEIVQLIKEGKVEKLEEHVPEVGIMYSEFPINYLLII